MIRKLCGIVQNPRVHRSESVLVTAHTQSVG